MHKTLLQRRHVMEVVMSFMSGEAVRGEEAWWQGRCHLPAVLPVHATRRCRQQRQCNTRCSRRTTLKFHWAQYFEIRDRRRPPNEVTDWLTDSRLTSLRTRCPPPPPLLHLVVISKHHSYCTLYSRQRHRVMSTRLLLITAASCNQTPTTCFARDSRYWTAFEVWPTRREPSKTGHKNAINVGTFSKPVTGGHWSKL